MRENKGTRHDAHFNGEYTLDLSGALGAKSQQEIGNISILLYRE